MTYGNVTADCNDSQSDNGGPRGEPSGQRQDLLVDDRRVRPQSAQRYLRSFLVLVLGLLMVQVHNIWTASWTLILTILGRLWVMGGAFAPIVPTLGNRFMMWYVSKFTLIKVRAVPVLALGLFLSYMGIPQVRGLRCVEA